MCQEMRTRAIRLLNATWSAIGPDCFMAFAGEDPSEAERMTMDQEDVIEAVTSCGYKGGYPEMYGRDKEALEWLDSQDDATKQEILDETFAHETYGL